MPLMSRRLDEDDEDILPSRRTAEREMTLGTGAILAIFFGLVILLGIFFGFGYKLGSTTSKGAGATVADASSSPAPSSAANPNAYKPAAGSPVGANTAPGITVRQGQPVLTPPPGAGVRTVAAPAPATSSLPAETAPSSAPLSLAHSAPATSSAAATAPPAPPTTPGGTFVVQGAAVSHQEDADLLVNALHARGYSVSARSESGDKLVHIQVGPFRDKKDADAMRQRLLADGYNAFVK